MFDALSKWLSGTKTKPECNDARAHLYGGALAEKSSGLYALPPGDKPSDPLTVAQLGVESAMRQLADLSIAGADKDTQDAWHTLLGIRIDIRDHLQAMAKRGHKPCSERRADEIKRLRALKHEEMRAEARCGVLGPSEGRVA